MTPNIYEMVLEFIKDAKSNSLSTSKYKGVFNDLNIKASFGNGTVARVPWIAFLPNKMKIQTGVYPILLHFKNEELIILSVGLGEMGSNSKNSSHMLEVADYLSKKTIKEYFSDKRMSNPFRYGASRFIKAYPVTKINPQIENDLVELIERFKEKIQG